MKCLLCKNYSLTHICSNCQELFLTPSIYHRLLPNGTQVISFYKYEDIKELLFSKHTDLGFYIYTILAKCSFAKFANTFNTKEQYVSIGIDDNIKSGYSHTAILNKHLQSYSIEPLFNKLRATNSLSYSGQSRLFREENPRNFKLNNFKRSNVILVDDIVTTGTTLTQAIEVLHKADKKVTFCLTLCDVNNK
ncbi:phosphoribosyltransferase family protein [Sulfurimonas sp.]|uniref:ComF family protein n=1 Tax=Sulfurimonas sp. TaxID=2022749 RepID=UPI00261C2F1E|nr:phosphoribosyltransferase family protein [Sulfurimonas sp.]